MPSADPDNDLLAGLRAGQSAALQGMMDRHLGKIHALAYHMLHDHMLAEDVTQESFIKLWQAAPSWREGDAKMLTWLRRVTTNRCLDHLRKKGPIYTDEVPDIEDGRNSADQTLITADKTAQIQAAVRRLPERQKAAIALSYYQHVSQREGAKILSITEKAYESLLVRARKNLKTALAPHMEMEL